MGLFTKTFSDESRDYLNDLGPMPGQSNIVIAGAPASSSGPGGGTTPTDQAGASSEAPKQAAVDVAGGFQRTGSLQDRLLNPIQQSLTGAQGEANQLRQDFSTQAGPQRSWDSVGGSGAVEQAIQSGQDTQGLTTASYGGPASIGALNPTGVAGVTGALDRTGQRAREYKNPGGLQGYVQNSVPGVTSGMARYDAAQLGADKGFQEAYGGVQQGTEATQKEFAAQEAQSAEFARQRATQEAEIRKNTLDMLQSEASRIQGQVTGRVDTETARNKQLQELYDKITSSGDVGALAQTAPGLLSFDPSTFNTQRDALALEAQAKRDSIMADPRFASIKDIPLMTLGINNHGVEVKKPDPEWKAANRAKYGEKEWNALLKLMGTRQDALRDAGFAYKFGGKKHTGVASNPDKKGQETAAQYSEINPLYFGTPWEQVQEAGFLNPVEVMQATVENQIAAEERARYNAIQSLLGGPTMDPAGLAYEQAKLGFDQSGFQQAEDTKYEDRREQMAQFQQDWARLVNQARGKYEESRANSMAGFGDPSKEPGLMFSHMAIPIRGTWQAMEGDTEGVHETTSGTKIGSPTTAADYEKKPKKPKKPAKETE